MRNTRRLARQCCVLGLSLAAGVGLLGGFSAQAANISLFEYKLNIDGAVGEALAGADVSQFDTGTGLGKISVTLNSAGDHFVGLFVDHEIDQAINTFFNEYGQPVNTASIIQSWEVDEPGFLFGDIYNNFIDSTAGAGGSLLDNSSGVQSANPDDVAMAIGWNFELSEGDQAFLEFVLSDTAPLAGFYLEHIDPDSEAAVYFSATIRIELASASGVPDLGSGLMLLLSGVAGLGMFVRPRKA
jgi:hypothetical protein